MVLLTLLRRDYESGVFDRQDTENPLNGGVLDDPEKLRTIVRSLQTRAPFMAELIGADGRKLLLVRSRTPAKCWVP